MDPDQLRPIFVIVVGWLSKELGPLSAKAIKRIIESIDNKLEPKDDKELTPQEQFRIARNAFEALREELACDGLMLKDGEAKDCATAAAKILSKESWDVLEYLAEVSEGATPEEIRKAVYSKLKIQPEQAQTAFDNEFSFRLLWLDTIYGLIDLCTAGEPTKQRKYTISPAGSAILETRRDAAKAATKKKVGAR
ncbi:MAG TPA: hypothetical protein EYN91_07125 [Candidatus Melainabacteria bacterium]|nr:hypothetical protein [Candidatus Melainabacteria bacterium]HIN66104.1 hypothetical protein [Candidatus Obscuribacterales bacterium]